MSIDNDKVKDIAKLARIDVPDANLAGYATALGKILTLVETMQNTPTDNIEPMAHPLSLTQRLRTDEVTAENHREKFQAIAPDAEAGLYLVPQVIE